MSTEDSLARLLIARLSESDTFSAVRDRLRKRSTLWLLGNSLAALASRSAGAVEQWGIVVLIARTTTPATVGVYGLASAVVMPVFGLFGMDLRALLATDYDGRHRATEYMAVRLTTALLAMVCVLVGAVLLGHSPTFLLVVALVALRKVFEGLSDILYAVMQKYERMDLTARSAAVKALVSLGVAGLLLLVTRSLVWALGALVLTSLGILFLYDTRLVKSVESTPVWRAEVVRRRGLVRQAMPLGLVTALIALQTTVPRYFLAVYHGDAVVGHLTALSHFLIAGTIVNGAFQQSAGPRLAKYFTMRQRDRFIAAVIALCCGSAVLGVAGVCFAVLFGPAILSLVYGRAYVEFADVLPWFMVAGIGSYVLASVSTALTVVRQLRVQAVAAMCSVVVCGAVSWAFIPSNGAMGAAAAVVAASAANVLFSSAALVREFARCDRVSVEVRDHH